MVDGASPQSTGTFSITNLQNKIPLEKTKMTLDGNCVICGRPSVGFLKDNCVVKGNGKSKIINNRHSQVYSTWKNECARTLCEVLLGSDNHLCLYYFQQNEAYCSHCQQTVRDINFTWRQIDALQKQLEKLSIIMRKRLHRNHLIINQNNSNEHEINDDNISLQWRLDSQDSLEVDQISYDNYSYNDVVQSVYKAASQVCEMSWPYSEDLLCLSPEGSKTRSPNSTVNCNVFAQLKQEPEECNETFEEYHHFDEYYSEAEGKPVIKQKPRPKRKSAFIAQQKLEKIEDATSGDEEYGSDYDCAFPDPEEDSSGLSDYGDTKQILSKNPINEKDQKVKTSNKAKRKVDEKAVLEKRMRERARKRENLRRRRELEGKEVIRKPFHCVIETCKSKFTTEVSMQIHVKTVHNGEKVTPECPKCLKVFTKFSTLTKHMIDQHSGSKRYDYYCKYCAKGYAEESELQAHYSSSHLGSNPFSCAFCEQICSNSIDLAIHMKTVHPEDDKLVCDTCGKKFISKLTLEIHSRIHGDPDLLFKCSICDHVTVTSHQLKRHEETHDTHNKYTCEICGKGFNYKEGLSNHSRYHTGVKKFKCAICEKAFVTRYALKKHEVIHTGIKDHICQTCGRAFTHRRNLKDHEKIHLREGGLDVPMRKQRSKNNTSTEFFVPPVPPQPPFPFEMNHLPQYFM